MARDPLAWQPLLRHWTRCLGAGGTALEGLGDLAAIEGLNLAELLSHAELGLAGVLQVREKAHHRGATPGRPSICHFHACEKTVKSDEGTEVLAGTT
jgi:hypothetical protein